MAILLIILLIRNTYGLHRITAHFRSSTYLLGHLYTCSWPPELSGHALANPLLDGWMPAPLLRYYKGNGSFSAQYWYWHGIDYSCLSGTARILTPSGVTDSLITAHHKKSRFWGEKLTVNEWLDDGKTQTANGTRSLTAHHKHEPMGACNQVAIECTVNTKDATCDTTFRLSLTTSICPEVATSGAMSDFITHILQFVVSTKAVSKQQYMK